VCVTDAATFVKLLVGDGTAVLIRASEPTEGLDMMKKNRCLGVKGDKLKPHELCNGPSKLTKVHLVFVIHIQTLFQYTCYGISCIEIACHQPVEIGTGIS